MMVLRIETKHEKITMRICPNCGSQQSKLKYVKQEFKVVKCKNCSLVYSGNPAERGTLYEEYYNYANFIAADYHRCSRFKRLSELFVINEQRLNFIKKEKQTGPLLDIGCGLGFFLKTARDYGFDIYGIDVSERAVRFAKNAFKLRAEVETLDKLIEQGKTFDLITLWHVLEHFIDPFEELKKIKRLLNKGGACFIEVPNLYSLKFMLSKKKWVGGNHPLYHRTFFSAQTLEDALLTSGFSKIRRIQVTYHLKERSAVYEAIKKILNVVAMDGFLNYVAWKL